MKLQEEALLEEIHELQSRVGFGNPSFWSVLSTKMRGFFCVFCFGLGENGLIFKVHTKDDNDSNKYAI